MNLVRWNNGPDRLDLEKGFEHIFGTPFLSPLLGERDAWSGPFSIRDEGGKIFIRVECPGLRSEDIRINVDGDYLTLQGERNTRDTEEGDGFRMERIFHGVMGHSLRLPESVDPKNIRAEFKEGMLNVELPKRGGRPGRKIAIEGTTMKKKSYLNKMNRSFRDVWKGLSKKFSAMRRSLLTQK